MLAALPGVGKWKDRPNLCGREALSPVLPPGPENHPLLPGTPSRTALGAALYRAAHQLVDRPPVLDDPLSLAIVGEEAARALRAGADPRTGPAASALRAFVALRSRYAEDAFAGAHRRGVHQCVILGAGLDTYAYRCRLEGARLFEVDHPATQSWKRQRLAAAAIPVPASVAFVAVNLEREAPWEALARAGLARSAPAFVAWLGVTPYLSREAIAGVLGGVARDLPAGSELAFDFAAPAADASRAAFAARVESAGEPLRSTLEPGEVEGLLCSAGLKVLEIANAAVLTARYLSGRADGLALRGGHLALARRPAGGA